MTKLAYLSSTALCALALVAGVTPAAAEGELFGTAHFGFDWTNYDPEFIPDFDSTTFIGQGAVGIPLGNGWSGQMNFSFESQDFDLGIPLVDLSLDTWQVGGVIAYQDAGRWKGGLDLAYQVADFGISIDGYRAGLRGEYYASPNFTLRGAAGWQDYNNSGIEADGFYGGIGASYYFTRNIALSGSVDYHTYDLSIFSASVGDYDVWDFGGKLEYKCDEYPIAFGGHVNYATIDAFGFETDAWNFGLDITAFFGDDARSASLRDAEMNAPFAPERLGVKYI